MAIRHDPYVSECATLPEISRGLGLSREALPRLRRIYRTFPLPVATFGKVDVFWRQEVEAWHLDVGRIYGKKTRVRTKAKVGA